MNTLHEGGGTMLIVDDEVDLLSGLARSLSWRLEEFDIITAGGGEEALELLAQRRLDLVLLDIKMDGMDGMEGPAADAAHRPRPDHHHDDRLRFH